MLGGWTSGSTVASAMVHNYRMLLHMCAVSSEHHILFLNNVAAMTAALKRRADGVAMRCKVGTGTCDTFHQQSIIKSPNDAPQLVQRAPPTDRRAPRCKSPNVKPQRCMAASRYKQPVTVKDDAHLHTRNASEEMDATKCTHMHTHTHA